MYGTNSDLAELNASVADMQKTLAEIRAARVPGLNQPMRAIQRHAKQLRGHEPEIPFDSIGELAVALAGTKGAGVSGNEGLLRYCRSMDSWLKSPQATAYYKTLPTGFNEAVGSDGGILVAPQFANDLMMRVYQNDILSRTTMFPLTNSNAIAIPAVHETSRADGSRFGGVQAYWRDEAETVDITKSKLKSINLKLNSLLLIMRMTDELMNDAPAMSAYIDLVADQEMAFKVGQSLIRGDGVGKPKGIFNSLSKIRVSPETGQPAGSLVTRNFSNMWSRLHLSCRQNAVWLYDQSCEPALDHLTVGTAGAQLAVYLPKGTIAGQPYATMKGAPMIPTEFNSAVGTEGDVILTDLATLLTASQTSIQSAVSMHIYFLTHEQAIKFVFRLDGQSWWLSPLTPASGGPTQSNVVTLETRS